MRWLQPTGGEIEMKNGGMVGAAGAWGQNGGRGTWGQKRAGDRGGAQGPEWGWGRGTWVQNRGKWYTGPRMGGSSIGVKGSTEGSWGPDGMPGGTGDQTGY